MNAAAFDLNSFEFQMVCVVRLLLASVLFLTLFLCLFQHRLHGVGPDDDRLQIRLL